MPKIEFINRAQAESDAARGVALLDTSDEAKGEAWFAMQAVADQYGPESNTGRRGISLSTQHGSKVYKLRATCVDGVIETSTGVSSGLDQAEALLESKIAEKGGRIRNRRPKGISDALVEAVSASPEGKRWADRTTSAGKRLLQMVSVADAYGREGINPRASLSAHMALITFDNRAELILGVEEIDQARAKALSLRGYGAPVKGKCLVRISTRHEINLAIRAGVTRQEARMILRARVEGRSQKALIRAVKEADSVLAEPTRPGRPRKDGLSVRTVAALA